MSTIDRQVAASADDVSCYRNASEVHTFSGTANTFFTGYVISSMKKGGSAHRFTNITIPQGNVIDVAYITFGCAADNALTTVNSRLYCEAADNSAQISGATDALKDADLHARTPTTKVSWDNIGAWTTAAPGPWYDSPSIVVPVQEVISRSGWVSGNALTVYWEDFEGRSTASSNRNRQACDWDTPGHTFGAKLHIEYHTPATVFWRRWFGPADAPGKVQWDGKLETLGAGAPDKVTTTLAEHEDNIEASAWAAGVGRAYFGCRTAVGTPYRLLRFNPADNTYSVYVGPATSSYCMAVIVVGSTVFAAFRDASIAGARLATFNTSTSPPELIQTYAFGNYVSGALATNGTFLFLGNSAGQVLLIRISDMALVHTLQLTFGGSPIYAEIHALTYHAASSIICATINDADPHGYCFKLYQDGTTLVQDAEYDHGHGVICDDIVETGGAIPYVWLPVETIGSAGGCILRIPRTAFNSHEHVPVLPVNYRVDGVTLDSDGTHLLVVGRNDSTLASQLSRLTLADLTVERVWFADAEIDADDVIQYASGKYLIATWGSPAQIINLTNPFPNISMDRPASGYWASLCLYAETTPAGSISDLEMYTDGVNGLGTGWSALGQVATEYTEPTGEEGVSGDELNTTNYPTLEAAPDNIFGWTSGGPKPIDGSLANPDTGDIGEYGVDNCFFVIQLVAAPGTAPGLSSTETLTLGYTEDTVSPTKIVTVQGLGSPSVTIPAVTVEAAADALLPTITAIRNTTVSAVTASAAATCPLPAITTTRNSTILALSASAAATCPLPTILPIRNVSLFTITATAAAIVALPTITATKTATVAAVTATATATAPSPTIVTILSPTVLAVTATAATACPLPSITAIRNPTVLAETAEATVAALLPTIAAGIGTTVVALTATAGADALLPVIEAIIEGTPADVLAVTAEADADAPQVVVGTTRNPTVSALTATAAASVLLPTIAAIQNSTILAVTATVTADALLPTVELTGGTTVLAVPAAVAAAAQTPTVLAICNAAISAAVATATATALVPTIGVGFVYTDWDIIVSFDPTGYPTSATITFVAVIWTSNASYTAGARLYNVTDDEEIIGSAVSTAAIAADEVESGPLSLPQASKEYRAEWGGVAGATYKMSRAEILVAV